MQNYTAFPFWRRFLQSQELLTANPFDHDPLGPAPVFLYSEATAPLPCAARSGIWNAYPDVRRLAAHLRFGLLPCHFGIWLCRDEWDPRYRRPCTVEDLCRGARAAGNRYAAHIPLMEEIAATLDRAVAAAMPAEAWRHTRDTCRRFNRRWRSTPSWNFVHLPLKDGKALLRDLAAKDQSGLLTTKLKAQFARPPLNENTQAALREVLQNAAVC